MPFHVVLVILVIGGIALVLLAVSGAGSRDRSNEQHPRLPGHETQEALEEYRRRQAETED